MFVVREYLDLLIIILLVGNEGLGKFNNIKMLIFKRRFCINVVGKKVKWNIYDEMGYLCKLFYKSKNF